MAIRAKSYYNAPGIVFENMGQAAWEEPGIFQIHGKGVEAPITIKPAGSK